MWLSARLDIAEMFAELQPTQWSALAGAWLFKPAQYWSESGEMDNRSVRSRTFAWQASNFERQERAERRARRRRALEAERKTCCACGQTIVHDGRPGPVRRYCDTACQRLADKQHAASIERHTETRRCLSCGDAFVVDQHQRKKICSGPCQRKRERQQCRARYRATKAGLLGSGPR